MEWYVNAFLGGVVVFAVRFLFLRIGFPPRRGGFRALLPNKTHRAGITRIRAYLYSLRAVPATGITLVF